MEEEIREMTKAVCENVNGYREQSYPRQTDYDGGENKARCVTFY